MIINFYTQCSSPSHLMFLGELEITYQNKSKQQAELHTALCTANVSHVPYPSPSSWKQSKPCFSIIPLLQYTSFPDFPTADSTTTLLIVSAKPLPRQSLHPLYLFFLFRVHMPFITASYGLNLCEDPPVSFYYCNTSTNLLMSLITSHFVFSEKILQQHLLQSIL